MKYKCPICKKEFDTPAKEHSERAIYFPFCSERCRLIDLGAWLDGKYKVISNADQTDKNE